MTLSEIFAARYSSNASTSTSSSASAAVLEKVSKIMAAKNTEAPKLNAALATDNAKLSGLGKLLSSLSSFQSVAQSLSGNGLYASATVSSGNVLSATTSGSAVAGSYAIKVSQLATAQSLTSKPLASQNAAIGSGSAVTLKFDFGSTSGTTFTPAAASKTVVIHSKDNSLQGIASAINEAAIGVKATITSSAAGYALTLTSPSGSANTMRLSVSGDQAVQKLLAYNPAGQKNLTPSGVAKNAEFSVNGVAYSQSSNVVSDALAGSKLNLTATGSTSVVVTRDESQLTKNITSLVATYNALNTSLNNLQQGELKTGSSVNRIQSQLAQVITSASSEVSGQGDLTLAGIGITTLKDGSLAFDASKLQAAITANPEGVARLFTYDGKGVADKLATQIQGMVVSTGSVSKEAATLNKDIALLNDKKSKLEKKLTLQANALVKIYSQQNSSSFGTSSAATGSVSSKLSLFDYF